MDDIELICYQRKWINELTKKLFPRLLLVLSGMLIFVLGSPHYSVFPTNRNQAYYLILTLGFSFILYLLGHSGLILEPVRAKLRLPG